MIRLAIIVVAAACMLVAACADDGVDPGEFRWDLPGDLPAPVVPDDNPMTLAKIELGRHLFYDTKLSANETQSCGSCHEQRLGFADGLALPMGSTGDVVPRNSPGLMNIAYFSTFNWINPNLAHIDQQVLVPIFGEFPTELGVTGNEDEVLARFASSQLYLDLFADAFPGDPAPVRFENIAKSLASFVRSMVSFDSPFDRYTLLDDRRALTEAARRGLDLFLEERLDCHHCHGGFNLSLSLRHEKTAFLETGFANNGLYNLDGVGSYPAPNEGLYLFSGRDQDRGKFRTPTLRNIALTAPYMHDGSIATLREVIEHYAAGGRNITSGPNAGDGRANPNKSEFVHGFELSEREMDDVLAFFEALTDETFINDPKFSNPFE